jgi:hypothetical protein
MSFDPLGDHAHILRHAAEAERAIRPALELQKQISETQRALGIGEAFANSPALKAAETLRHVTDTFKAASRLMATAHGAGGAKAAGSPATASDTPAPSGKQPNDSPVAERGPRQYLKTEPEQFRVERDDARDLAFIGWKLGTGYVGSGKYEQSPSGGRWERETEVTIYVTKAGDYVVHESRTRDFDVAAGDKVTIIRREDDLRDAPLQEADGRIVPVARSAEERLLESLRMGSATRDAWNEACKNYPPLQPLEVETLE